MASQSEQTERFEALRGLVERLGAPDVDLTEAKALRDRLNDLLANTPRPTVLPAGTSMRAAG